jgi:anti-anti-sigma factor
MSLQCDEQNGTSVITVTGDFNGDAASALRAVLSSKTSRPNVIVDLEACRFIASTALEALIETLHICEERGGRLILASLDENCRKILQITRLDHRFECHDHVATALRLA